MLKFLFNCLIKINLIRIDIILDQNVLCCACINSLILCLSIQVIHGVDKYNNTSINRETDPLDATLLSVPVLSTTSYCFPYPVPPNLVVDR